MLAKRVLKLMTPGAGPLKAGAYWARKHRYEWKIFMDKMIETGFQAGQQEPKFITLGDTDSLSVLNVKGNQEQAVLVRQSWDNPEEGDYITRQELQHELINVIHYLAGSRGDRMTEGGFVQAMGTLMRDPFQM